MSDIITARQMLLLVADSIRDREPRAAVAIDHIVEKLMRRTHTKRKSPVSSERMDSDTANAIRVLNGANPEMSAQMIADIFKVNPGRVSEAIAGKW
jgi:hypothetical protein